MYDTITAGLLLNAASIPCSIFMRLCEDYGAEELAKGEPLFDELGMTKNQKQRVFSLMAKDSWPERELERTHALGARFITAKDVDFPAKLFDLKSPPVGLYVKGPVNLSLPSVAIVGTRKPTAYGQSMAFETAKALVRLGIIIISGGALGIDAAGHRAALAEGARTIAVFGTGLDKIYPAEHRTLFSQMAERGAVVSEYPFGTAGEGWRFVTRNRVIAALAGKVVVAESPEGGGAMKTAEFGFELGREVWAVPGHIDEAKCKGSNRLIQRGARILVDIAEFAGGREQLSLDFGNEGLEDDDKKVYSLLQRQGGRTLDEIARESGVDAGGVTSALATLEAQKLVVSEGGRYYEAGKTNIKAKPAHEQDDDAQELEAPASALSPEPSQPLPDDDESRILSLLREHNSLTLDEIASRLSISPDDATISLMSLEADGRISSSGGRYSPTE